MAGYEAPIDPRHRGPHWALFAAITGKELTQAFVESVQYEADYADYIRPGSYQATEILVLARAAAVTYHQEMAPTVERTGPGYYVVPAAGYKPLLHLG